MSETVIQSRGLGKKFIISHRTPLEGELFVDLLMNRARDAWNAVTGKRSQSASEGRYEEFWALRDVNFEIKAGELVAHVAQQIGGKGGGRPDMAQGGGEDSPALATALDSVPAWIEQRLA